MECLNEWLDNVLFNFQIIFRKVLRFSTQGKKREMGGGIGMGNTCKPMAVSFQCMTKFTTNKKKKKESEKKKEMNRELQDNWKNN